MFLLNSRQQFWYTANKRAHIRLLSILFLVPLPNYERNQSFNLKQKISNKFNGSQKFAAILDITKKFRFQAFFLKKTLKILEEEIIKKQEQS